VNRLFSLLTLALLTASCGSQEEFLPDPLPLTADDTLFIVIEGGPFVTSWGDTVNLEAFEIARFEVSNRLYYWLADRGGLDIPPDPGFPEMDSYLFEYPDNPVVNLSATEAGNAATVIGCRLPTPAEWEYAATIGLTGAPFRQYPWGQIEPQLAEYPANYLAGDDWDTRTLDGFAATAPVGSYPLSPIGLADLAGNVSEWTYPLFSICMVKGGSWVSQAEDLMTGSTLIMQPGDRTWSTGFRLAR